jgi:PRTRC genetic system protein C
MVTVGTLKRVFEFSKKGITLPDPNPQYTIEQVRDFYSNVHPELVNCTIEGPKLTSTEQKYEFKTSVGTKG